MNDDERLLEVPSDEDENVGDAPEKRKLKRRKSKEERAADRKVVFWTLLIILGVTGFFWMWPKMKQFQFEWPKFKIGFPEISKPEWKNYVEYKL